MMEDNSDITDAVGELIRKRKEEATHNQWKTKALKWIVIILVVLALVLLFAKEVLAL